MNNKTMGIVATVLLIINLIIGITRGDWLIIMITCIGLIGSIGTIFTN